MMYGYEKSDSAIVATKLPNKAGQPVAEAVERRAETKGNVGQQSTCRAQDRESVTQALIGIGGCLATPPLPHRLAYGSVPRRFE